MISINGISILGESVIVSYECSGLDLPDLLKEAIQTNHPRLIAQYDAITKPKTSITLDDIEEIVCRYMNVSPQVLQMKSRKRDFLVARQFAQALAKKFCDPKVSYAEIGERFGNYDHATVMHNEKEVNVTWRLDKKYGYGSILESIEDELRRLQNSIDANRDLIKKRNKRKKNTIYWD